MYIRFNIVSTCVYVYVLLLQVSYSIGVATPLSLFVNSYGTCAEGYTDDCLLKIVAENFDFRPGVIQRDLRLKVS